jgi:hypothetical protein
MMITSVAPNGHTSEVAAAAAAVVETPAEPKPAEATEAKVRINFLASCIISDDDYRRRAK